ncbi:MAG: siderophore-interacting protein [Devosiaceae bacterium]|nr:siderophore-interacting protein [Devosiaceae bacterium MH13]
MHKADRLRWRAPETTRPLPTNFTFARVRKVERLGPVFFRVTVEAADFSRFGESAIHFRLVLPNASGETAWPTVTTNDSIKWAEGSDAPHRPVYTARWVDHESGLMAFDVFIHEGGRTTEWANAIMAGDQSRSVVGVVGPSGGGLMQANHVLLAADETGFPAAARLLENLPDHATGTVLLEAEDAETTHYPILSPTGVNLRWLSRSRGEALGAATIWALREHSGAQLWFAGERSQANAVRHAAIAAGWDGEALRVSGFWRTPGAE